MNDPWLLIPYTVAYIINGILQIRWKLMFKFDCNVVILWNAFSRCDALQQECYPETGIFNLTTLLCIQSVRNSTPEKKPVLKLHQPESATDKSKDYSKTLFICFIHICTRKNK